MMASDFQRKIKQLNSRLHIYCGNDDRKPAGIFHVVNGEYMEICGIDKNVIPEFPITNETGRILKGGWRRALRILISSNLIDRCKAEKVFATQIIGIKWPNLSTTYLDPVEAEIEASCIRNMRRTGKPAMSRDDIMDVASVINK